ncbi:hypothetical protein PCL_00234 [Purpureocillium lilacinum]|uniref:Uncharacterized protein n=1 Tax=Purpureocillium lilacinum TaxID=33203 RepID=A0A2U3E6F4_PURLI|nr:hypothetical protein PCL_00234 [Purpureocillium lilacinum]
MTTPRFLRSTQSYQISTVIDQEPSMTRTFSFNPEAMIRRVAKASGAPNASLAALKFGIGSEQAKYAARASSWAVLGQEGKISAACLSVTGSTLLIALEFLGSAEPPPPPRGRNLPKLDTSAKMSADRASLALDIGKATLVQHCQPRGQLWQLSRRMGSKWVAYGPAHHVFGQKGDN